MSSTKKQRKALRLAETIDRLVGDNRTSRKIRRDNRKVEMKKGKRGTL